MNVWDQTHHQTLAMRSLCCRLLLLVSIAIALQALGCGPSASPNRPPTLNDDTTLGAGDVFEVRVYGEEDMNGNYRVEQDGTIDFPYLGRVEVINLEPPQIAELLETRLRGEGVFVDPQVSVFVTEIESRRVSVIGAVRNPGNYPVRPGLTALQAVGLAGGTTDLAQRDGTILTRRVDGEMRRYQVPLDRISVGNSEDVPVRGDDIIVVPERPF
ncbi:MAG: polysaccharide biosynthesis/export family protein [Sandaracinaceae bacterium]